MVDTAVLLSAGSMERRAAMQLSPDEQELFRRAFHVKGKAIRQIQRETGHIRQATRRAISNKLSSLKPAPSSPFRSAPIFGPFQARVEASSHRMTISPASNDTLPIGSLRSSRLGATRAASPVFDNTSPYEALKNGDYS